MKYYKKFINFIQKHNLYDQESFIFISNHTRNIDFKNNEDRDFIGCYYKRDNRGNLVKFKVYVPEIVDDKTILINIHEYVHALILYKNLNKPFKIGIEKEVLPLMYEKLYVLENEELSMKQYEKSIQETINEMNKIEYTYGSKVADELITSKEESIEELSKKAKKLMKKYKK